MTERKQSTTEFVAAVKPVCEAATEGPWYSRGMGGDSYLLADAQPGAHKVERVFDMFPLAWPRRYLDMDDTPRTDGTAGMRHDDARFCALARLALPEALERLAEADKRIENLERRLTIMDDMRGEAVTARDRQHDRANAAERERDVLRAEVKRLKLRLSFTQHERDCFDRERKELR